MNISKFTIFKGTLISTFPFGKKNLIETRYESRKKLDKKDFIVIDRSN